MADKKIKKDDYLTLTGNYSLNGNNNTTTNTRGLSIYNDPFAKKTTSLSTPQVSSTPKVNLTNQIKTDLSPTNLIAQYGKTSSQPSYTETTTPSTEKPSAFKQYLSSINQIANRQKTGASDNLANTEKYYTNLYDTTNKALLGQIPESQQDFENYKAAQQARVSRAESALPGQEEMVTTDYGAAQKARAQTRAESEARLRNQFAGMNASDSYGAGSLTSEISGLENTFNAQTASAEISRLGDIFKLRQSVQDVKDESDSLVNSEEVKLRATIRSINSQVGLNNIEKENLIQQAYQIAQDKVDEIDSYIAQLEYQNAGTSTAGSENKNKVATMIQNLLNADTNPITGFNRIVLPGTKGATTKADWEGLKNLLALAKRGELKGSGAVSDFEAKMLEKAAMAGLDPTMDDATFRSRLQLLMNDLSAEGAVASSQAKMLAPDGNVYTVDQSEVQQATANGWRRV